MKLIQVAHAMTKHDGASKFVLEMDKIFKELGYSSEIYAHKIDERIEYPIRPMASFDGGAEDIVIYHMTTGTSFNKWVYNYPHKIVLYYHNITPAKYFFGNAWGSFFKCLSGRRDLKKIVRNTFYAWGASEYSCRELRALGMAQAKPLAAIVEPQKYLGYETLPLLYNRYHDDWVNLLVVGRGVPHKKQDEAIRVLKYYHDHISEKVRLIIVGNIKKSFDKKLHALTKTLQMEEHVIFTGMVSQEELCTYYRLADAVLSLSEHEGFCVPLVEGMIFEKPVFAYACAAVPETLGQAGILLRDKSPEAVATVLQHTLGDAAALQQLAIERKKRLAELSYDRIRGQVEADLQEIIKLWRENH